MDIIPKISIIVPVYNTEQYLEHCIESLVMQTLHEIEIICVNDGSPDNSLAIIEDYASRDNRVKIITTENQGLACARNNGVAIASGEYLGFVDSDDWVGIDFYEKLYALAKEYDADVAGGDIIYADLHHKWRGWSSFFQFTSENVLRNAPWERKDLCFGSACWNKIYKRSFILNNGFLFPPSKDWEDGMFIFKVIFSADKIVMDRKAEYFYRQRITGSITADLKASYIIDRWDNCEALLKWGEDQTWAEEWKFIFRQVVQSFMVFDGLSRWQLQRINDSAFREAMFIKYKNFIQKTNWSNNTFLNETGIFLVENIAEFQNADDFIATTDIHESMIIKLFGIRTKQNKIKRYNATEKKVMQCPTVYKLFNIIPLTEICEGDEITYKLWSFTILKIKTVKLNYYGAKNNLEQL